MYMHTFSIYDSTELDMMHMVQTGDPGKIQPILLTLLYTSLEYVYTVPGFIVRTVVIQKQGTE